MKTMHTIATAAVAALVATGASAQSYSTGFEQPQGFTPGAVAAGANEGNTNWQAAANGSTSGAYVTGVAHSGTQSLAIIRTDVNNGTIHGVRSPELLAGAGEAASGAASNRFNSSFWFRSGEWRPGTDYFASVNAWSTDRMSWVALDYTGGNFSVYGFGYNQDGSDGDDTPIASNLALGTWYRLDQSIDFVNGAPDRVTFRLFDGSGQIGTTAMVPSWDGYYLSNGIPLTPVNQLNFASRVGGTGTVFYIDDVSYSIGSVPEPATWAMLLMGFAGIGAAMRRRATARVRFA